MMMRIFATILLALIAAILTVAVVLVSAGLARASCDPWIGGMCQDSVMVEIPRGAARQHAGHSVSLSGVVEPLASKAREIVSVCGSVVISAVRHTLVRGTRRISLHASGRAVDLRGNPGCIRRVLAGWPGGMSSDYGTVSHYHVSYDPDGRREWGARFAHWRPKKRRVAGRR